MKHHNKSSALVCWCCPMLPLPDWKGSACSGSTEVHQYILINSALHECPSARPRPSCMPMLFWQGIVVSQHFFFCFFFLARDCRVTVPRHTGRTFRAGKDFCLITVPRRTGIEHSEQEQNVLSQCRITQVLHSER